MHYTRAYWRVKRGGGTGTTSTRDACSRARSSESLASEWRSLSGKSMQSKSKTGARYARTPDGRYFVVRGRLWRLSNPMLSPDVRAHWVAELMSARRAVRAAKTSRADLAALETARSRVSIAKHQLGERGPPWWSDDARDYNRTLVKNSPYALWYEAHQAGGTE